jgi:D-methionine transport system substrate-binding protein
MKKHILAAGISVLALGLVLAGCGSQKKADSKTTTVRVGIVGSDKRVWQPIANRLKKQNINIKIVSFADYNKPNQALLDGDIDLNAFQHQYFLDNWNKTHKSNLKAIGKTVLAPLKVYSNKISNLKKLKKGDTVTVPNDPTNEGRALQLLETAGLITLDDAALPTTHDIKSNKLHLTVTAIDASQTARSLKSAQAAVVNSGVATDAGLKIKDSIYTEKITAKSKPWINIIVAKGSEKNNKVYKKIVKAFQTEATAKTIKKVYRGNEVPAWNYKF